MSGWNHNLCERCWFTGPEGALTDGRFREPVRAKDTTGVCCHCGTPTVSGIFVRRRPTDSNLLCQGDHEHPEVWSPYIGDVYQGTENAT